MHQKGIFVFSTGAHNYKYSTTTTADRLHPAN